MSEILESAIHALDRSVRKATNPGSVFYAKSATRLIAQIYFNVEELRQQFNLTLIDVYSRVEEVGKYRWKAETLTRSHYAWGHEYKCSQHPHRTIGNIIPIREFRYGT